MAAGRILQSGIWVIAFALASVTDRARAADAIYSGGPIITMRGREPEVVEALAVKDGRIGFVGPLAEARGHAGPATRMVDLGGKTLLPGFIDTHGHFVYFGKNLVDANLFGAPDIADLVARMKKQAERTPPEGWIVGFGYQARALAEGRPPTSEELDRISADRPVMVVDSSGHLGAANAAAFRAAGITADTPDPTGGAFARKADGKSPAGPMEETALNAVRSKRPPFTGELAARAITGAAEVWASHGQTTAMEAGLGLGNDDIGIVVNAIDKELLPIDLYVAAKDSALDDTLAAAYGVGTQYNPQADGTLEKLRAARADLDRRYVNRVRLGGVKFWLDGSLDTAWFTQPYTENPPGKTGAFAGYRQIPDELLDAVFEKYWPTDLQIHMHMNGDAAADQALAAIDKAVKKHGMHDHRPVFVHATWLRPDQIERMKACGAIPSFLTAGIIPGGDAVVRLWGPERSAGAMASRTFLRAGLPFTYSHDAPVSPVPSILALVDAGVNRLSGTGRVVGPDERISPYDALRAVTATAAYQLKEEKTKGTLEPGKLADLVILDRNPLAGDPLTIKDIAVVETIKEGRTVYRADGSLPAVECTPRGGLPHFFAKAKAGGEVRVAYLGGSITAAPGWRVGSLEWLRRRFPEASFREINAAIGGTGSDLGAFRVGQDVIAGKPDLVFVEFAVNDGGTAPEQIQATMEGIVRQVKRADPATDICFVYTLSSPVLADLQAGRCQRSAAVMETVADHYRIPSVHFGPEVAKRIAAGTLVFKGEKPEPFDAAALPMLFSTDGVHPLVETGHGLYTDVLTRSLEAIEQAGQGGEPPAMPDPLRGDHWEAARLVPITREMLRGEWQRCEPEADPLGRQFANRMPALWKTAAPGASLAFRVTVPEAAGVKTRRLAAYDLLGPGGGMVEVRIDGGEPRKLPRIDGYCTYWRLATLPLGNLPPGEHTIEVTLTADHPDKRTILFEHNRKDLDSHPEKYAADAWYVGGLLVFGEARPAGQ